MKLAWTSLTIFNVLIFWNKCIHLMLLSGCLSWHRTHLSFKRNQNSELLPCCPPQPALSSRATSLSEQEVCGLHPVPPECEEKTALVWDCGLLGFPWVLLEMEFQRTYRCLTRIPLGIRGLRPWVFYTLFHLPFLCQQFITWLNRDLRESALPVSFFGVPSLFPYLYAPQIVSDENTQFFQSLS